MKSFRIKLTFLVQYFLKFISRRDFIVLKSFVSCNVALLEIPKQLS